MTSKKRAHLQQFDIIHLPILDLTNIRNLERETKLCFYRSTSLKLKSGTLRQNKIIFRVKCTSGPQTCVAVSSWSMNL
jgi:hypothetical protein